MPSTMNTAFSASSPLPVLGSPTANSAFAPPASPLRRRRTVLPRNDAPASAAPPRIRMHVERIETGQLNSSIFLHSAYTAQAQQYQQQLQQHPQRSSTNNNNNALANGKSYPHPVVVLSFITENCRACMYAKAGFERLAREFAGLPTHRTARFFEIDVSNVRNHRLGQQLGITAVPSFQLYAYKSDNESDAGSADNRVQQQRGAFGVIDEMVGPRVVGKIRDRLLHYCSDAFDLNDYVFDD